MVTMQEVATAAGVSRMTVSNVINDHRYVSDETRAKVERAITELGYRVNVAARNLRAGHTGVIGLAVPEVDHAYFSQLAAVFIELAEDRGYRVAVEQTGASRENELAALAASRVRMYDGLILSTVGLGPMDSELLRVDYPVVILGERIFDGPVDHVAMANTDGARVATEHLIAKGCIRLAFIGAPHIGELDEPGASNTRLAAFRDVLREHGLDANEDRILVVNSLSMSEGERAAGQLMAGVGADGVVCANDSLAIGAMRAVVDAGLRVPQDVRVIGFDGIAECRYVIPSLTTIEVDHRQMATDAFGLLMDRVEGDGNRPAREIVAAFQLIERESTA